jgi:hypothetical protein
VLCVGHTWPIRAPGEDLRCSLVFAQLHRTIGDRPLSPGLATPRSSTLRSAQQVSTSLLITVLIFRDFSRPLLTELLVEVLHEELLGHAPIAGPRNETKIALRGRDATGVDGKVDVKREAAFQKARTWWDKYYACRQMRTPETLRQRMPNCVSEALCSW